MCVKSFKKSDFFYLLQFTAQVSISFLLIVLAFAMIFLSEFYNLSGASNIQAFGLVIILSVSGNWLKINNVRDESRKLKSVLRMILTKYSFLKEKDTDKFISDIEKGKVEVDENGVKDKSFGNVLSKFFRRSPEMILKPGDKEEKDDASTMRKRNVETKKITPDGLDEIRLSIEEESEP